MPERIVPEPAKTITQEIRFSGNDAIDYALMKGLVRDMRKHAGFTQEELGARVDLSQVRITHIETGARNARMTVEQFAQIVRACGLELTISVRSPGDEQSS